MASTEMEEVATADLFQTDAVDAIRAEQGDSKATLEVAGEGFNWADVEGKKKLLGAMKPQLQMLMEPLQLKTTMLLLMPMVYPQP